MQSFPSTMQRLISNGRLHFYSFLHVMRLINSCAHTTSPASTLSTSSSSFQRPNSSSSYLALKKNRDNEVYQLHTSSKINFSPIVAQPTAHLNHDTVLQKSVPAHRTAWHLGLGQLAKKQTASQTNNHTIITLTLIRLIQVIQLSLD